MIISFQSKQIRNVCEYKNHANESYGEEVANELHKRIAELMAYENVSELIVGCPSERIYAGVPYYSIEIIENLYIFFKSSHVKTPTKDGAIDWSSVSRIKIIDISDKDE